MPEVYKLELKHIRKEFPGVVALDDLSLQVRRGTVHAIVGENGAGKSTMMKIINGVYRPDAGEIYVDGKRVEIPNSIVSAKLGIAMIYQELNFMPEFTVAEHLFITREQQKMKGIVDWKLLYKEAQELLDLEELPYDPHTKMKNLSVSDIQLIEIVRALSRRASILIMDEPTASISGYEVQRLFKKIRSLREQGVTILYISHKMDEIQKLADEVTIIRDGQYVDGGPIDIYDSDTIVSLMVGRKIEDIFPPRQNKPGEEVMKVEHISAPGVCDNLSFTVHKGEILGFAGLVGSGRTEIMSLIAGLKKFKSGKITLYGRKILIKNVRCAIREGILMATEDRKRYGLVGIRSILENISLPNMGSYSRGGVLKLKKEKEIVSRITERLRVKAPSLNTLAVSLSGGNQQKVVLSKWLLREPQILILDEPTKGIDVGTKHEIYNIMNDLTKQGTPIIMISSDLSEIIGMCDRVYVVNERRIVAEYKSGEITQENIMRVQTVGVGQWTGNKQ